MPQISSLTPELLPAFTPFKTNQHQTRRTCPGLAARPQPAARSLDGAAGFRGRWRSSARPPSRAGRRRCAGAPAQRAELQRGRSARSVLPLSALIALMCPPPPARERRETPEPQRACLRQLPWRWQGRLPRSLPVRVGQRGREPGAARPVLAV